MYTFRLISVHVQSLSLSDTLSLLSTSSLITSEPLRCIHHAALTLPSAVRLPVIRLYGHDGVDPHRRVIVDVHGILPYLLIGVEREDWMPTIESDEATFPQDQLTKLHQFMYKVMMDIQKAIQKEGTILYLEWVKFRSMDGYSKSPSWALKVSFTRPSLVQRLHVLLAEESSVLNRTWKVYEAHLSYILQFQVDYNIDFMKNVTLLQGRKRHSAMRAGLFPCWDSSHFRYQQTSQAKVILIDAFPTSFQSHFKRLEKRRSLARPQAQGPFQSWCLSSLEEIWNHFAKDETPHQILAGSVKRENKKVNVGEVLLGMKKGKGENKEEVVEMKEKSFECRNGLLVPWFMDTVTTSQHYWPVIEQYLQESTILPLSRLESRTPITSPVSSPVTSPSQRTLLAQRLFQLRRPKRLFSQVDGGFPLLQKQKRPLVSLSDRPDWRPRAFSRMSRMQRSKHWENWRKGSYFTAKLTCWSPKQSSLDDANLYSLPNVRNSSPKRTRVESPIRKPFLPHHELEQMIDNDDARNLTCSSSCWYRFKQDPPSNLDYIPLSLPLTFQYTEPEPLLTTPLLTLTETNWFHFTQSPPRSHQLTTRPPPPKFSPTPPDNTLGARFKAPSAEMNQSSGLRLLSMELIISSRSENLPRSECPYLEAICLAFQNDEDYRLFYLHCSQVTYSLPRFHSWFVLSPLSLTKTRVTDEKELIISFLKLIERLDPDVLLGWQCHSATSWGTLLRVGQERYGWDMIKLIGVKSENENIDLNELEPELNQNHRQDKKTTSLDDYFSHTATTEWHIPGRFLINTQSWLRHEIHLHLYSLDQVTFHVMRLRMPLYETETLLHFWHQEQYWTVIHYKMLVCRLCLALIDQTQLLQRSVTSCALLGIDFHSHLARGSQYHVEALLSRIARIDGFALHSRTKKQIRELPALEALPLVMQPVAGYYKSPVVVLDYRSLYPSLMMAYNLCYSTCLLNSACSMNNITDKELFASSETRQGLLPQLVSELLACRHLVKSRLKALPRIEQRYYEAVQLALKLVANVCYGYTAATYSGRMPMPLLADSIVSLGRYHLREAITWIERECPGKVVYGDTDSIFIAFPCVSLKRATFLGSFIAQNVTSQCLFPIQLQFEKIYYPCLLQTKKRYCGMKWESPFIKSQFEAKGIETVRRDVCLLASKTLEQLLKCWFQSQSLMKCQLLFQQLLLRLCQGKVPLSDLMICQKVKNIESVNAGPSTHVARQSHLETEYNERVPILVMDYSTISTVTTKTTRLRDHCILARDYYRNNQRKTIHLSYYVEKQLEPCLNRDFSLMGVNVVEWKGNLLQLNQSLQKRNLVRKKMKNILTQQTPPDHVDSYFPLRACLLCSCTLRNENTPLCSTSQTEHESFIEWHLLNQLKQDELKMISCYEMARYSCLTHHSDSGCCKKFCKTSKNNKNHFIAKSHACDAPFCRVKYERVRMKREWMKTLEKVQEWENFVTKEKV